MAMSVTRRPTNLNRHRAGYKGPVCRVAGPTVAAPTQAFERPPAETPAPSEAVGFPAFERSTLVPPGRAGFAQRDPAWLVGQSLGDFDILGVLGYGGMGVLYKARQKSIDRTVALKKLLTEHFHNAVLLNRFLSEARAAAALCHPDIVDVYQADECSAGHAEGR
jgi:hypothetical protein